MNKTLILCCTVKVEFTLQQASKTQTGEQIYISTRSLTSALHGVGGQRHTLAALPLGRPSTHCVGGCVGHRTGLGDCGKYPLYGIRSSDRPDRGESLCQLSYHGPQCCIEGGEI
jgi:hypothetical protein